jgi:outer membrane protein TolC
VLQTEVLDRSRMALEALQKAYELGEIAFNDVLAEQRRLADLQGAYNSVLQAYATAAADLAQAVAVPIP